MGKPARQIRTRFADCRGLRPALSLWQSHAPIRWQSMSSSRARYRGCRRERWRSRDSRQFGDARRHHAHRKSRWRRQRIWQNRQAIRNDKAHWQDVSAPNTRARIRRRLSILAHLWAMAKWYGHRRASDRWTAQRLYASIYALSRRSPRSQSRIEDRGRRAHCAHGRNGDYGFLASRPYRSHQSRGETRRSRVVYRSARDDFPLFKCLCFEEKIGEIGQVK